MVPKIARTTSFFNFITIKSVDKKIIQVCQLIRDFCPNDKATEAMMPINPAKKPLIITLTDFRCLICS